MDIVSPKYSTIKFCKLCHEEKMHTVRGVYTAPVCVECMQALPPVPEGKKRCAACLDAKDVGEFTRQGDRLHSWCKTCHSDIRKQHYNAELVQSYNLWTNYRLTKEEYDLMFFRQGGVCAVCGQPETAYDKRCGKVRSLSVDHNHETGEVRQLLCSACNGLLGYIEKDRERVKKLLKYLKKHDT